MKKTLELLDKIIDITKKLFIFVRRNQIWMYNQESVKFKLFMQCEGNMSLGSFLTIISTIHFTLHIYSPLSLFIPCFRFREIASMTTHSIHSAPFVPNPIFILFHTFLTLSHSLHHASQGPYLYLHRIVSWIICFSYLLFRENCHCNLHWGWNILKAM